MLRVLLLALLLIVKASTTDFVGSGDGYDTDDEPDDDKEIEPTITESIAVVPGLAEEVKHEEDNIEEDENTTIIIIAAVSVVALAIVAIIAVILFRHHLRRREQGVYSVPVDQEQKGV